MSKTKIFSPLFDWKQIQFTEEIVFLSSILLKLLQSGENVKTNYTLAKFDVWTKQDTAHKGRRYYKHVECLVIDTTHSERGIEYTSIVLLYVEMQAANVDEAVIGLSHIYCASPDKGQHIQQ